jgi:hypothetical protein
MSDLAPIILFVYNRPWHTEQTLKALMANELSAQSTLFIYSDGLKKNADEAQKTAFQQTKEIIKRENWCKKVFIVERKENLGLVKNVLDGVTEVINKYGKIIVLEDDLVTSPFFLNYCNDGLNVYENISHVFSINAYQFPLDTNKIDTFLCTLATTSWGWATWKDRWNKLKLDLDYKNVIQDNKFLRQRFNLGDYDYANMLDHPKSWAIKWHYTAFLQNGLGLFPSVSLIYNIGFDGSGENCTPNEITQRLYQNKIKVTLKEDIDMDLMSKLTLYFEKAPAEKVSQYVKIKRFIKKIISPKH